MAGTRVVYLSKLGPPVYVVPGGHAGLIIPGNIDVAHLPIIVHGNLISTVRSVSWTVEWTVNGRKRMLETLMPTVLGRRLVSDRQALDSFMRTKRHLGAFDTVAHANAYADRLHNYKGKDWHKRKKFKAISVVPA